MTTEELRQKYPLFIFEKYEYKFINENLEISYYFSLPPDHKFSHKIVVENCKPALPAGGLKIVNLENLIFHVGLSLMPSYWKAACSPKIEIQAGNLSEKQLEFWKKLFIKGMGEYFYKNEIDFTYPEFLTIKSLNTSPHPSPNLGEGAEGEVLKNSGKLQSVLIPIGGGKDSIVTLELLKTGYPVTPFMINPVPEMINVCQTAGFTQPLIVNSQIDPYLLELNRQGYLNGHVPVSAFYAFTSVLVAAVSGHKYIAFSNERSSFEGNTEYLNRTINHQYSKTLEFETDFNSYLVSLISDIKYFSFLRPLYELQIAKIFCRYPQYFSVFTSCNSNFKLDSKGLASHSSQSGGWCGHCPKCVSTALLLAAWLGKAKVTEVMGVYPPDLSENAEILKDLTGDNPIKPFECVLTRDEAKISLDMIAGGPTDKSRMFMTSWMDDPNMPPEFEKILKYHLASNPSP
jgi:hypothetical protein